jgi:polyhydroxyalkanoate synthesis regulator phasin
MTVGGKKGGWKPGQSGNPNGRPPGSSEVGRLRAAISEHLPKIIEQLVQKARDGDTQAARLLLERVLPPVKATESTIEVDLPEGASLTEQGEAIVRAVADGTIPPGQAGALLTGLGTVARLKELDELTARIEALEAGASK